MPSIDARLLRLEQRLPRPYESPLSDFDHAAYRADWERYTAAGLQEALLAFMVLYFGRYEAAGWVPEEAEPPALDEVELDRALSEALAAYEADPASYRAPAWLERYRADGGPDAA